MKDGALLQHVAPGGCGGQQLQRGSRQTHSLRKIHPESKGNIQAFSNILIQKLCVIESTEAFSD